MLEFAEFIDNCDYGELIQGLIDKKNKSGYYLEWKYYNCFETKWQPIPKGFKHNKNLTQKSIKKYFYPTKKNKLNPTNEEYAIIKNTILKPNTIFYKTHFNYGKPFLVYYDNDLNTVYVYSNACDNNDSQYYILETNIKKNIEHNNWYNIKNVCSFLNVLKVFMSISPKNEMT